VSSTHAPSKNRYGDQGLASLLFPPCVAHVLPSLKDLDLYCSQITDEGRAALASALRNGALPALETLHLYGNRSDEAWSVWREMGWELRGAWNSIFLCRR